MSKTKTTTMTFSSKGRKRISRTLAGIARRYESEAERELTYEDADRDLARELRAKARKVASMAEAIQSGRVDTAKRQLRTLDDELTEVVERRSPSMARLNAS